MLGHQIEIGTAVVSFPRCQKETDRKTLGIGPKVDLGREAIARTAKSLAQSPPFPPAAQWCARTMVLSIICTASAPPPAARAASIKVPQTARRPAAELAMHRVPVARQGAPVRAIQTAASSVRRWSRGGRPRSGPLSVTNGSNNAHSSSVNRPRITADLPHEDQRRITSRRVGEIPLARFVHAA
jgi:hypothetical protein